MDQLDQLLVRCGKPAHRVTALAIDSRQVQPGAVFFAYPGEKQDGRAWIADALARGAIGVVYEAGDGGPIPADCIAAAAARSIPMVPVVGVRARVGSWASQWYGDPSLAMRVVGVTGTNGKTSVVHLIRQWLAVLGVAGGSIGTLGVFYQADHIPLSHTTPDPIQLQQILSQLRDQHCQVVAMEVSSHALEQDRIAGVAVETAILTQITHDHLDYHGTFPAYVRAKCRLFEQAGVRYRIFNGRDPAGRLWAHIPTWGGQVGVYLRAEGPDTWLDPGDFPAGVHVVQAAIVQSDIAGMVVHWRWPEGQAVVSMGLSGAPQLENALAAFTALYLMGWEPEALLAQSAILRPPVGRMERFGGGAQPYVVVDYAHTPDALDRMLGHIRALTPGRLAVVFGCGGDRDPQKRPMMGAIASRWADLVVVTDDNPRTEPGDQIVQQIVAGMDPVYRERVRVQRDRAAAIQETIAAYGPGDVVVVAGKGHESVQITAAGVLPFSDQWVVQQALGARASGDGAF